MTSFDESQQRVFELDPRRHARVLGAPGSGKSALLVESYARLIDRDGWSEDDVLVLAPSRLAASQLRAAVLKRVQRAVGGSPVRTASSFAFSIASRSAAQRGETPPRLLTGTVQDELIAEAVQGLLDAGPESSDAAAVYSPEVLLSAPFRAELRELWRVTDDFAVDPPEFPELGAKRRAEKHLWRVHGSSVA